MARSLTSEGKNGLDTGEFPNGLSVTGGVSYEAGDFADSTQDSRESITRSVLLAYRTARSDQSPEGHFRWLGQPENTCLPISPDSESSQLFGKISSVLFWIKRILLYPLGLRMASFVFSTSPPYFYFSSSCQGCCFNPFLLVLIATSIF